MHSINTDELKKRFIVIEGIDGAGTTTQMNLLAGSLRARGLSCVTTAEPTTSPIGMLIRSVLSGKNEAAPSTVAHLFAADRNEHLYGKEGIAQKVEEGALVISDRYVLSSLAYQGVTCGPEIPWQLNSRFPAPGLTLLFEVDPEVCIKRIDTRSNKEIYETLEFQKRVHDMYAVMADRLEQQGWHIERINADGDIETVRLRIEAVVFAFLGVPSGGITGSASRLHS
ncbi:MAG: dTMP kinase [Spirochaetia bacterium]|jgi:dTMP kinase|nr:dTMP kinase [Spirochaetia bacterium]